MENEGKKEMKVFRVVTCNVSVANIFGIKKLLFCNYSLVTDDAPSHLKFISANKKKKAKKLWVAIHKEYRTLILMERCACKMKKLERKKRKKMKELWVATCNVSVASILGINILHSLI